MAVRKLIAGNWKMNLLAADGVGLAGAVAADAQGIAAEIVVCPPATLLVPVAMEIADSGVGLAGQDCHAAAAGAHTGDISAEMLADAGCRYVIVGHSERRSDHGEDDAGVRAKAAAARRAGLTAIVCVGESGAERDAGSAEQVVERQLRGSLGEGASAGNTVVAYEPVWAIGTGRTPTVGDIAAMHARIRAVLSDIAADATSLRILYGGSVKPGNAADILGLANVDGALVGGASLIAGDFLAICRAAGG